MDKHNKYLKAGLLEEKRKKADHLEMKADRLVKDVNIYLFSSDGIKGMEFEKAHQAFVELTETIMAFRSLVKEIKKIEDEM